MLLSSEKNEKDEQWDIQKKRTDKEAQILREFIKIKNPYKPGTREYSEFSAKTEKTCCNKLGGISLHELYHKLNILICMVDLNTYAYTLRMISDLNNIGYDCFDLSIAHNNKTGDQKYTYITYPQDYELKNLNEVLDFMDAELYETSYRNKKVQHKLIINDKEKEKQLYKDELEYKTM